MQKYTLQTSCEKLEVSESLWAIALWLKLGERRIALAFFPTAVLDEGNFPENSLFILLLMGFARKVFFLLY